MVILLCYIKVLFKSKLDSHEQETPATARPNTGKAPPYTGLLNSPMKRKANTVAKGLYSTLFLL